MNKNSVCICSSCISRTFAGYPTRYDDLAEGVVLPQRSFEEIPRGTNFFTSVKVKTEYLAYFIH